MSMPVSQDLGVSYSKSKDRDGGFKTHKLVTQQLKEVMDEVSVPLFVLEGKLHDFSHGAFSTSLDEPSMERTHRVLRVTFSFRCSMLMDGCRRVQSRWLSTRRSSRIDKSLRTARATKMERISHHCTIVAIRGKLSINCWMFLWKRYTCYPSSKV